MVDMFYMARFMLEMQEVRCEIDLNGVNSSPPVFKKNEPDLLPLLDSFSSLGVGSLVLIISS